MAHAISLRISVTLRLTQSLLFYTSTGCLQRHRAVYNQNKSPVKPDDMPLGFANICHHGYMNTNKWIGKLSGRHRTLLEEERL
jgi:hypothetical protein